MYKYGEKKRRSTIYCLFALLSVLAVALLVYAAFMPHNNEKLDNEQAINFTQGWKYQAADGTIRDVTSPSSLPENIPGGIRITNTLPADSAVRINSIGKYCVFQHFKIYVDGALIYSTDDPTLLARHFDKTSGTFWLVQRLPENSAGKQIALEITSAYPDYRQLTGTIYLGTKAAILFSIVNECFGSFLVSILLMIMGALFCIFFLLGNNRYNISASCLYIGALQFWVGAWEFSESGLMQLVTGNAIFGTALSFTAMRMSAFALLIYFRFVAGERWRRWNDLLLCVMAAEAVVSAALQLTQAADFYETVQPCHVILVVAMLTVIIETLLENFHYHNRELRHLFFSMMLVAAAAVYEVIYFYFKNGTNLGNLLTLGLVCFTLVVSIFEIRKIIKDLDLAKKAAYFKQLADTDVLTGLANRGALREWFASRELLPAAEKEKLAVIVSDVDELKRINDENGHLAGDQAICAAARFMRDIFAQSALCCRTGGDEFACVLEGVDPEETQRLVDRFLDAVAEEAGELPFAFSVSIGFAYFSAEHDKDLKNTMFRADQQMYHMKHRADCAPERV